MYFPAQGEEQFLFLQMLRNNLKIYVERNYFGSEHGKNESDTETGIIAMKLNREIKSGISLSNAKDIHKCLK